MKKQSKASLLALLLFCMVFFGGCGMEMELQGMDASQTEISVLDEDGAYSAPDEVALYIHTYGDLPDNFITKEEARALGWESAKGNLWEVAEGMSIGGDAFGNREGRLPKEDSYTECDVNYAGGFRGSERIVFSDDGDIYYTGDHYQTFEQLY